MSIISKIKSSVSQNIINIPGFRTKKKIVVIESDDWGSIRMPSKEVYSKFIAKGLDLAESDYNKIDTIESNEDLINLYELLRKHKDSKGNPAVITANCVVGNPDFEKIRQSGFNKYYYEPVTETLSKQKGKEDVVSLWRQGAEEGIFHPQFHGREHVNVVRWMEALRKRTPEIMFTFENGTTFSGEGDYNFMEVLDFNTKDDLELMEQSLKEGLDIFENIFGYRSKSFIPPCYTWDSNVEKTLAESGVKYIQGLVVQSIPTGSFGNYKKRYHYMGQKNSLGQRYLVRNAFFEPSLESKSDPVGACLKRINIAFKWHKPAILSSHRINFIGSLVEENRSKNLKLLDELLRQITKLWPDVEFMTSDQLGEIIESGE